MSEHFMDENKFLREELYKTKEEFRKSIDKIQELQSLLEKTKHEKETFSELNENLEEENYKLHKIVDKFLIREEIDLFKNEEFKIFLKTMRITSSQIGQG